MELRPARHDDHAAINSIRRRLNDDRDQPQPAPDGHQVTTVVAVADRTVVGWVTVGSSVDDEIGLVLEVVVDPAHRRRGHGRRLLINARRVLADAGRSRAELWAPTTDDGRPPAMPLELGWRADGPPRAITSLGEPVQAVRLVLDLVPEGHVAVNRQSWNDFAPSFVAPGRRAYQPDRRRSPTWGIFAVPEAEVGFLREVAQRDVVELGCGTGYVSAWCLEAGARSVVALDNAPAQLATASVLQDEFDVHFPLVLADAERAPLADDSFDLAVSEYGAALWCDPHRWIPEAARLLRPGGRLVFLTNSVLVALCANEYQADGLTTTELRRPQRGMHRISFPDTTGIEFHLAHGDLIRLLRRHGFSVVDLVELYAPADADDSFGVDATWATLWPAEEMWVAELTGRPTG
jgi:SAM-dependent methyltransferase/GNAT superfamily N-acetyltransferase